MEKIVVQIDGEKCTGCGVCVEACPRGAIGLAESKAVIDETRCNGCQQCLEVCPQSVIYSVIPAVPAVTFKEIEPARSSPVPATQSKAALIGRALSGLVPLAVDAAMATLETWAANRVSGTGDKRAAGIQPRTGRPRPGGGLRRRRRGELG